MKRLSSVFLTIVLVMGMSMPVCAAQPKTTEGESEVSLTYSVASSYSITIPESVAISGNEGRESTYSINANSLINAGQKLQLTITDSANSDEDHDFRMISSNNTGIHEYLDYSVTKPGTPTPIQLGLGSVFLEADPATVYAGESVTLTYKTGTAHAAGAYTDTVTITVTIVNQEEAIYS